MNFTNNRAKVGHCHNRIPGLVKRRRSIKSKTIISFFRTDQDTSSGQTVTGLPRYLKCEDHNYIFGIENVHSANMDLCGWCPQCSKNSGEPQ